MIFAKVSGTENTSDEMLKVYSGPTLPYTGLLAIIKLLYLMIIVP